MRIEESDDSEDEIEKIESENEDLKKMQKRQRQIIIIVIFLNVFLIGFCIFLFFWRVKNFNTNTNKSLVVEPKNNYSNCIIFLHELNDKAKHFKDLFEKINFKKKNSTKLIFMPAPNIEIVNNNNINQVKEWYDANIIDKNLPKLDNFEEETKSIDIIKEIINQEAKLLNGNYSKIIIGGFSQGASLSLYTGNTEEHLLGGAIFLYGNYINENKNKLNAFLLHRKNDKIIPFSYQEKISNYEGVSKYYNSNVIHFANNSFTPLISRIANFLDKIL